MKCEEHVNRYSLYNTIKKRRGRIKNKLSITAFYFITSKSDSYRKEQKTSQVEWKRIHKPGRTIVRNSRYDEIEPRSDVTLFRERERK